MQQPRGKEIDVILDTLSAHKSAAVGEFLDNHRQIRST